MVSKPGTGKFAGLGLRLEGEEAVEGAGELAVKGDLITKKKLSGMGVTVGGGAESGDGADGGRSEGWVLKGDFAIQGGGLDSPDAPETPAGDGHGLNQQVLGCGGGLELLDEGGVKFVEAFGRFGLKDDGLREEAVAGGVAGGVEFALRGDGALGFCAVSAGGLDLFVGWHGCTLGVRVAWVCLGWRVLETGSG